MAKGTNYGLVTAQDRNMRSTGGSAILNRDVLTREDAYAAMRDLMITQPNFDQLSVSEAARRVMSRLKEKGFRGSLTASNGTISDSAGNAVQLTHGKDNGVSIITIHDKKKKKK